MIKKYNAMHRSLLGILALSLLVETAFFATGMIAPGFLLEQFKIEVNADTLFLAHVIAWMLLFISIICGMCLYSVSKFQKLGWTLSYILGFWWVGIGLALCLGFGKIDNLFLDTFKGILILIFAYRSKI